MIEISQEIIDFSMEYQEKLRNKGAIIGDNVLILPGTRIDFKESLFIGDDTFISKDVYIKANSIKIGVNCIIFSKTNIYALENLEIGERCKISSNCNIKSRKILIGNELWCNHSVDIGGGDWRSPSSQLIIGDFQHIGMRAQINTANKVELSGYGGIGIETALFTSSSGEGQSFIDGFSKISSPIKIEKNVSVFTRAMILPGTTIKSFATIAAGAIVRKDVKQKEIIAGVPGKVIGHNDIETDLVVKIKNLNTLMKSIAEEIEENVYKINNKKIIICPTESNLSEFNIIITFEDLTYTLLPNQTLIHIEKRYITGNSNDSTEYLRDKFRQAGTRLKYYHYNPSKLLWEKLVIDGIESL